MNLTPEQQAAVNCRGKVIVSASAGSGKTSVMIRKLTDALCEGADLEGVVAVTFTKKAAAQMKEKLRAEIISRLGDAPAEVAARLKLQLSKIPSANISTIHSLCGKLLRTYFYALDISSDFDVISADDAEASVLQQRVLDSLFERYYAEDNASFKQLLKIFFKGHSDDGLRKLIVSCYSSLRIRAHYAEFLKEITKLFTPRGFEEVCRRFSEDIDGRMRILERRIDEFARNFGGVHPAYAKIFDEMREAAESVRHGDLFAPLPKFTRTARPHDAEYGDKFAAFRDGAKKFFESCKPAFRTREEEEAAFIASGATVTALAEALTDFDSGYTAVKRDENKLDYNDLEQLTVSLLSNPEVRGEIASKYSFICVDEYQDVNPVQEEIISMLGCGELFLVGDVKQAIYGFRGSKSAFFAEKYAGFGKSGGTALKLSSNFRSSDGVINFVNEIFADIMTDDSCGFDYTKTSFMTRGADYPAGYGSAQIHVFGKEEKQKNAAAGIYSVKRGAKEAEDTREGLAVAEIVRRELESEVYDPATGGYRPVQQGDICILTRKNDDKSANGIVRALKNAGYTPSGAQTDDLRDRPEVKKITDILSYIDNSEQDIPLATALLSPLGGFTADELARIRTAYRAAGRAPFRLCCKKYAEERRDEIAEKLNGFYGKAQALRDEAEICTAAEMVDILLESTGLESEFAADGGEKLRNVRRFAAEGEGINLCAFMQKLGDGQKKISPPAPALSDSVKIMTMHASKGLEFPIVIIADVCAPFKGRDAAGSLIIDDEFGFAPKFYDDADMTKRNTVLGELCARRKNREELKNELNLFYVACTRAMSRLHIMAETAPQYDGINLFTAGNYAQLFDINAHGSEIMQTSATPSAGAKTTLAAEPDKQIESGLNGVFERAYPHAESVDLPVKSSASAIIRFDGGDDYYAPKKLFPAEESTGAERGIAYHRYLQLADLTLCGKADIERQLKELNARNLITDEGLALLSADNLSEILSMPVFADLRGATLYREREFLCSLPASSFLDTSSQAEVLVQGAIDLLAVGRGVIRIIDYKYSAKDDAHLVSTYAPQLALYKLAVSKIMNVPAEEISTHIVNIFARRLINL